MPELASTWIDNVFSLIEILFNSSNGAIEPMMLFYCEAEPTKILPLDFRQSLNKVVSFRKSQIIADMIGATGSVMVAQAFKTDEAAQTEEILYILAELGSIKISCQAIITTDNDGVRHLGALEVGAPKRIVGFTDYILQCNRTWPTSRFVSFAPRLEIKEVALKDGSHLLKIPSAYQEEFWAPEVYSNGLPVILQYGHNDAMRYLSGYYYATTSNIEEDLNRFGLAALDAMAMGFFPIVDGVLWSLPKLFLQDPRHTKAMVEKFFFKYALDISVAAGESLEVRPETHTSERDRVFH